VHSTNLPACLLIYKHWEDWVKQYITLEIAAQMEGARQDWHAGIRSGWIVWWKIQRVLDYAERLLTADGRLGTSGEWKLGGMSKSRYTSKGIIRVACVCVHCVFINVSVDLWFNCVNCQWDLWTADVGEWLSSLLWDAVLRSRCMKSCMIECRSSHVLIAVEVSVVKCRQGYARYKHTIAQCRQHWLWRGDAFSSV